jgi:hypothetical protein
MTTIFRTAGAWGAGKGSDLTPAEVDGNFWDHLQRIVALETAGVPINEVDNITVTGGQFSVFLTDGTEFGPFALPVAVFNMRGTWAPTTAYTYLDLFTTAAGLYMVLISHTSASTFDPNRTISGQPVYHLVLPNVNSDPAVVRTDTGAQFSPLTEKDVPVSADFLLLEDSEATGSKRKVRIGNIGGASAPSEATDFKESVRAFSNAPITLSGLQTVDGVALLEGDFELAGGQGGNIATPHVDNGLYVVHSGAWTRRDDADTSAEVTSGLFVYVEEGSLFKNRLFTLTTPDPINLGVTPLQFSARSIFPYQYLIAKGISASSYTLLAEDAGKWIRRTGSSASTTIVPNDSTLRFPINAEIFIQWYGTGSNDIVADTGVTINSMNGLSLPGRYAVARLKKRASNNWTLDFPPINKASGNSVTSGTGYNGTNVQAVLEELALPTLLIFAAGTFVANEVLWAQKFTKGWKLPTSLTGSYATLLTAATGSTTFTLKKNGTSIGTIVFAASGTVATFTFASPIAFVAGDVLTLTAPGTPDGTAAGLHVSLLGG